MLIFIIVSVIFIFLVAALYIGVFIPFSDRRREIKSELSRSDGREYDYWQKQLKNLYLSHIPIIGLFIKRDDEE